MRSILGLLLASGALGAVPLRPAFHYAPESGWFGGISASASFLDTPGTDLFVETGPNASVDPWSPGGPGPSWNHLTSDDFVRFSSVGIPSGLPKVMSGRGTILGGSDIRAVVGGRPLSSSGARENATVWPSTSGEDLTSFGGEVGSFGVPHGFVGPSGVSGWLDSDGVTWVAVGGAKDGSGGNAVIAFVNGTYLGEVWKGGNASVDSVDVLGWEEEGLLGLLVGDRKTGSSMVVVGSGTIVGLNFTEKGIINLPFLAPRSVVTNVGVGEQTVYGWITEQRAIPSEQLWSGVLSLPVSLAVDSTGGVLIAPAPNVVNLRSGPPQAYPDVYLPGNASQTLSSLTPWGTAMELNVTLSPDDSVTSQDSFSLHVLEIPGTQQTTTITVSQQNSGSCMNNPLYDETDTLAPGISSTVLPTDDPKVCQQLCCNTSKCAYFTFVTVQPLTLSPDDACQAGDKNCCWLKEGPGKFLPKGGCPECTSGQSSLAGDFVVTIDRSKSSTDPTSPTTPVQTQPFTASLPLQLRVFIDGSILEVFLGDQQLLIARVYPEAISQQNGAGVSISTAGNAGWTAGIQAWALSN